MFEYCDPHKPLVLACDASNYGIGAVLSHIVNVGEERPITYISCTLSPAEKHYSQLEKEALAIVFAVKKFHHYLIGRHFTIESNHQPLKTLLGETCNIPHMASSRIIHWAITLWIPGTVVKVTGTLLYHIKLTDNRVVQRHLDAVHVHHESSDP